MMHMIGNSFSFFFSVVPLFCTAVGVAWGIIGGAIPGISPSIAIVLALPFTYRMDAATAIITLASVYTGACYGSSIPAILIGTPGAPSSAATVADGYMLGKKGKGLEALGLSLSAGVIGGLIGSVILCLFVIPLGKMSLSFAAPEYFAICILGLSIVASLSEGSMIKAIISVMMGLAMATVGLDTFSGAPRFTMGLNVLMDGINDVSAMIGLFAIGEMFSEIYNNEQDVVIRTSIKMRLPFDIIRKNLWLIFRSGVIGTIVGVLPGAGSSLAGFVAYASAKSTSKHPEEFGKGTFEGVAAPEAANNGCVGGSLVPVLALGVPGSPSAAMIMVALIMHGVVPGPIMFRDRPDLIYTIFVGVIAAQIVLFFVGYLFIKPMLKIINLNKKILNASIMVLVLVGSFSLMGRVFEPFTVLVFGILGFWMKRNGYSVAALVLGLVLGDMIESELRRSLIMSGGSASIFVTRPLCLVILLLCAGSVFYGFASYRKTALRNAAK